MLLRLMVSFIRKPDGFETDADDRKLKCTKEVPVSPAWHPLQVFLEKARNLGSFDELNHLKLGFTTGAVPPSNGRPL